MVFYEVRYKDEDDSFSRLDLFHGGSEQPEDEQSIADCSDPSDWAHSTHTHLSN